MIEKIGLVLFLIVYILGMVMLIAGPFIYVYTNRRQERYRDHGRRTGEW